MRRVWRMRTVWKERLRIPAGLARSRRRLPLLLCCLPAAFLVLSATRAGNSATHPTAQAPVPADAELERAGALIGRIEIDNGNIFDLRDRQDDNWLFRLTDRLHPVTRKSTIRQQLLFQGGDRYSGRLIDESARLLRRNPYFYDASVRPVRYHDGKVDVLVATRDVWTFNPGFNFSRNGGKSQSGFRFEEMNLLGTGTDLKLDHTHSVDRVQSDIEVLNQHTFGTWFTTDVAYGTLSDGKTRRLTFNRPFYSLDTRHAGGFSINDSTADDSLYDQGELIDKFADHARFYQVSGGFSRGLVHGWTRRYTAGLAYDEHEFSRSGLWGGPVALPGNRRFVYPWLRFDLVQDDFVKLVNRNEIGRTEDFDLGAYATVQAGWADTAFGSSRSAANFMLAFGDGFALSRNDMLLVSGVFTGRVERGFLENGVFDGAARYYVKQSRSWLFFSTLELGMAKRLDLENQLLLGGDNGLRGYPLRYQDGTARGRFSMEERYFTDWYPLRLFRVGAAVFFDTGRTWGRAPLAQPSRGLLSDAGFGLRFGNARSGLGNVIHVDVAFPFDGNHSIKRVQFLVETKQEF